MNLEELSVIEKRHLINIDKFFKKECSVGNINLMCDILNGTSNISLRILDWFVTTYSCNNPVRYDITENGKMISIDVNLSYKSQLKTYHKQYFDPFKRQNNKIRYEINGKLVNTKICQLNFFKWAFEKHIIDFVKNNLQIIIESMNSYKKNHSPRSASKKQQSKTNESSYSAFCDISTSDNTKVSIEFS